MCVVFSSHSWMLLWGGREPSSRLSDKSNICKPVWQQKQPKPPTMKGDMMVWILVAAFSSIIHNPDHPSWKYWSAICPLPTANSVTETWWWTSHDQTQEPSFIQGLLCSSYLHAHMLSICPLEELVSSKLGRRYKGSWFIGKWRERHTNYRAKELRWIHFFFLSLYKSITVKVSVNKKQQGFSRITLALVSYHKPKNNILYFILKKINFCRAVELPGSNV